MPSPSPDDLASERSQDLVQRAQAGDRSAFDRLIRANEPRLARLVAARLGPELRLIEESQDVLQSALADAVRALPRFEYRGEGSFLRWLGTIVEHKVRHHVRALRREKRRPDAVSPLASDLAERSPAPSEIAAGNELEARYHAVLDTMPVDEREILLLHLELGCAHDEIAQALGIVSSEAVRKRIARALARLQAAMREATA